MFCKSQRYFKTLFERFKGDLYLLKLNISGVTDILYILERSLDNVFI